MAGTSLLVDNVDLTFSSFAVAAQDTVKELSTHSIKTAPVPSSLLRDLAADLGTKWRELGKVLGFPDTLIDYFDDVKESLSDKGNAMLGEWKRLNDDDATMEVLHEALKKIDMGHLMEKVAGTDIPIIMENKETHEIIE